MAGCKNRSDSVDQPLAGEGEFCDVESCLHVGHGHLGHVGHGDDAGPVLLGCRLNFSWLFLFLFFSRGQCSHGTGCDTFW